MLSATRHAEILRRLRSHGEVSVQALADDLAVSPSTIRRDLDALDAEGRLRRVRGGGGGSVEPDATPFREVARQAPDAKDAVAARAASLVADGDVVVVDIGTTTERLAHHLAGRRITVVTASLAVVDVLREDADVELVVLGGVLRRSYWSLVGTLTEQAVGQLGAHVCFLGTSGVREDGTVMDSTGIEVPVKRALAAASRRTVLLADGGKFPGTGLLPVCGPETVDVLVTDAGADPATLGVFRDGGAQVLMAEEGDA
ncbi:DeoR/GlpR family DNA-binding transcription regulator [Pseudokineococcus basanitobsidens]|uniref:DeoR/GlpR family DNA-binding transcription regulator n=1 Tax=Pseudokineococcus basanitobsidens TaxID=1926649 RepID=A0ABU8RP97_9ACTN